MTLLELLVKELSGSWPVEVHGVVQDKSGQIWFYKSGKPYYTGVIWGADKISLDFEWVHCDLRLERSEDYATAIVTREQYEATQQPAWDGEGLPPVGVKCKAKYNYASSAEWFLFECVGVSNGIAFGFADGAAVHLLGSEFTFRTETDRKRESAITSLLSLGVFTRPVAEKTIEAIEAGKIPGVKMIDVNVNK